MLKSLFFISFLFSLSGAISQQLAPPSFSQASGYYTNSISLIMSHGVPGTQIYYTLNGNEPTQSDILYTGPITIQSRVGDANVYSEIQTNPSFTFPIADYTAIRANNRGWLPPYSEVFKTTVVRAKAFNTSYTPSAIVTKSYFIDPSMNALYDFPVLSIAIDSFDMFSADSGIYVFGNHPSGNYTQKDTMWERIANFEYFDPNGTLQFNQDVRVRVHGGGSRHSAKKNLRIYGEYGSNNNFNYQFFDNTEQNKFKRILIRAGGHRPDCFPRDDLGTLFTDGLDLDKQHYQNIVLFVNGEYWGIHSIKERIDNYFFQNLYGIDDDFITVLDQEYDVQGGGHASDSTEMADLEDFVSTMDMTIQSNYDYVLDRIDVDNYIDYMSSEIFLSNEDWVYSNVVLWRKTGAYEPGAGKGKDGKFRWALYDLDGAFGGSCNNAFYTVNTLEAATVETGTFSSYSRFFRGLLSNQDFRFKFINRMNDLTNSYFKETVLIPKLNSVYNEITPSMLENVERWRYPSEATTLADRAVEVPSLVQWDTIFYYLDRFLDRRPRKIREHMIAKWNLGDSSLLTVDVNDQLMGRVQVNSILIDDALPGVNASVYPWKGLYLDSATLPLIAVPLPGYRFVEWLGTGNTNDTIDWTPLGDSSLTAVFEADPTYQPLVINEIMNSNSTFYEDNFQEFDDWLEIYNPNTYPINLSSCSVSKNGAFWQVPYGTVIQANSYQIIWHDAQTYQGTNHANFRLTNTTETVYLKQPSGTTIDSVTYPMTVTNQSYGRYPNGSSTFTVFTGPTPNMSNDLTGIAEIEKMDLEVYPNPTSGFINFNKAINFSLFDISGRFISKGMNQRELDLMPYGAGIYVLRSDQNETIKIIVQ